MCLYSIISTNTFDLSELFKGSNNLELINSIADSLRLFTIHFTIKFAEMRFLKCTSRSQKVNYVLNSVDTNSVIHIQRCTLLVMQIFLKMLILISFLIKSIYLHSQLKKIAVFFCECKISEWRIRRSLL